MKAFACDETVEVPVIPHEGQPFVHTHMEEL